MKTFTLQAVNRNRREWPYAHRLSDQHGETLIETIHVSEASLRTEVQASAARIVEGKANSAGQIPSYIDVDGISETVWCFWALEVPR